MDPRTLLAAYDDGVMLFIRRPGGLDAPKERRMTFAIGFCSRSMGEHIRTQLHTPALVSDYEDGYTAAIEREHLDLVDPTNPVAAVNDILAHWPVPPSTRGPSRTRYRRSQGRPSGSRCGWLMAAWAVWRRTRSWAP